MQKSVDRLLELTRLEQTQRLPDAHIEDVKTLLNEVITAMQPRAEAAGVRMDVTVDTDGLSALMDRELMKLALSNVVENAIAFSPSGACVQVHATAHEDVRARSIDIVVRDHGPGVDEHILSRIGERFVSTPRPNGAPKSSGLGLAIVKQIMDLHHGSFSLANADGGGARSLLRIPISV